MTNGYQRGAVFGGQFAHSQPEMIVGDRTDLEFLAHAVFTWADQQGYAHLETPEHFVAGFVDGFGMARAYFAGTSRSVIAA